MILQKKTFVSITHFSFSRHFVNKYNMHISFLAEVYKSRYLMNRFFFPCYITSKVYIIFRTTTLIQLCFKLILYMPEKLYYTHIILLCMFCLIVLCKRWNNNLSYRLMLNPKKEVFIINGYNFLTCPGLEKLILWHWLNVWKKFVWTFSS